MAIEIEEIGIRLRIADSDEEGDEHDDDEDDRPAKRKKRLQAEDCACDGEKDREGMIEECVRRVLRILDIAAAR